MENLLYNIGQILGITIVHSLWQGFLVYLILRLLFISMPALASGKKYNLSALGLLSISVWFMYTFCAEALSYNWVPVVIPASLPVTGNFNFSAVQSLPLIYSPVVHHSYIEEFKTTLYYALKNYLPYIAVLYAAGFVINLGRLGFAWNKIRVIKQSMIPAGTLQQLVNDISAKLKICKYIQVSFSQLIDVPCVIGYLKPILLLPVTITTQLSAAEIESVLLHELAHIKSNDYLVNLIQQIIAVQLFFNPFAQLINHIISNERENRCDDTVVQITGAPLTYAHALLKLEENRQAELKLALAATGKKYALFARIERMMRSAKPIRNIRHILLMMLLFAISLSSIAWLNPEIKNGKLTFKNGGKVTRMITSIIKGSDTAVTIRPASRAELIDDSMRFAQLLTDTVAAPVITNGKVTVSGNDTDYVAELKKVGAMLAADNLKFRNTIAWKNIMDFRPKSEALRKTLLAAMPEEKRYQQVLKARIVADDDPQAKEKDAAFKRVSTEFYNKLAEYPEWQKEQAIFNHEMDSLQTRYNEESGTTGKSFANDPLWWPLAQPLLTTQTIVQEKLVREHADLNALSTATFKAQADQRVYFTKLDADMSSAIQERDKKLAGNPEWQKDQEEAKNLDARLHDTPEWKKYMDDLARRGTITRTIFRAELQERLEQKETAEKKERPEKKERQEKKEPQ